MASVFLCHASEDKPLVEPIQVALAGAGCDVFYDELSLPSGGDYHARIRGAIRRCDVFIFIASPASLSAGKFTLTELKFARERWPSPGGRVLPVTTGSLKPADLPPYLQAATVLTVHGNTAAEVRAAVETMLDELHRKPRWRWKSAQPGPINPIEPIASGPGVSNLQPVANLSTLLWRLLACSGVAIAGLMVGHFGAAYAGAGDLANGFLWATTTAMGIFAAVLLWRRLNEATAREESIGIGWRLLACTGIVVTGAITGAVVGDAAATPLSISLAIAVSVAVLTWRRLR